MGRPKKIPPLATELTLDAWELDPACMQRCRELGQTQAAKEMLTVLTNERPARTGANSLDEVIGWERCLRMLEQLLAGKVRDPELPVEREPQIEDTLAWKD